MKKKSKLAERLARKIEKGLNLVLDPETFERTYAGRNQKAAGAYVWMMKGKGNYIECGSIYPASECVKSKYILTESMGYIYPEPKEVQNTR